MLREPLIEFQATGAVRVPIDLHVDVGICDQDSGNFCQAFTGGRLQIGFSRVEQNVGHIHDQSPRSILRLQNLIQLLQHAGAHLSLIVFRLLSPLFRLLGLLGGLSLR